MTYLYRLGYSVYRILAFSISAVISLAAAILRTDHGSTWQSLRELGITAYRKIADLKPVYRHSYRTHGLSLSDGRMPC